MRTFAIFKGLNEKKLNKPFETSRQSDVRIGVNEDFHVEHLEHLGTVESQDALEDDHVGAVHGLGRALPSVCHEVVHWYFDFASLLKFLEDVQHQFEVERVWMVEVVFVATSSQVLLVIEDLVEAIHRQESHPWHVQILDDLLRYRRLPTGASAANADHKRLHLLAEGVVPWRAAYEVNEFALFTRHRLKTENVI